MKGLLLAGVLAGVLGVGACAATSTEDATPKLQQVTAAAISAPDAGAIRIESQQRFPAKWEWRATHEGQTYACDADNLLRLPSCTAVGI